MAGAMGGCHGAPDEEPTCPPVEGATLWSYEPVNESCIGIRSAPDVGAELIQGATLSPGDTFWVTEEVVGEDGVLFLRLLDGGWLFDTKPGVGVMCVRRQPIRQLVDEALERARARVGRAAVDGRYHRLPKHMEDDYREQRRKVLGVGANGKVLLGISRHTGEKVAIKKLDFRNASAQDRIALVNEVEILLSLDHPHVGRLLDVYETEGSVTLVFEHLGGGELFNRIADCGKFHEQAAAETIQQVLCALRYIHSKGVVHRDLKLENILYDSRPGSFLKLIDFGFSMFCQGCEGVASQRVGTIGYLAPEVVSTGGSKCGFSCDLWSVGIIAYVLMSGEMPFGSGPDKEVLQNIRTARYSFSADVWSSVSASATDFVQKCLAPRPEDRPSALGASQHPWLRLAEAVEAPGAAKETSQPGRLLGAHTAAALNRFALLPAARRACLRLAAFSVLGPSLEPARRDFLRLDATGSGSVRVEDLRSALKVSLPEDEVSSVCERLAMFGISCNGDDGKPELRYSDFVAAAAFSEAGDVSIDILKDAFRRFDKDGSGRVAAESMQHILGAEAAPEIEGMFAEVSRCSSDCVAVDELVAQQHRNIVQDAMPRARRNIVHDLDLQFPRRACTIDMKEVDRRAKRRGTGPIRARHSGCYLVDQRWRIVFMLPFLFSMVATSNLVCLQ